MFVIPSPGILTLCTFAKLVIFAFVIRLFAEFGFFGDIVNTDKQIAFFCGFFNSFEYCKLLKSLSFLLWFKRLIYKRFRLDLNQQPSD